MARYRNGEIPLSLLVQRPSAEKSPCFMMPGMAAKFDKLVRLGQQRHGWTPVVSGSDDAYRSRPRQQHYWDSLPFPQAASPGTSSHGGEYQGRDSGAIDIGNWGVIGRDAFYRLARDAGFEPGFFDWEPWHIIDWSPWSVPATPPAPTSPAAQPIIEEDDMPVIITNEKKTEASLLDPDIGRDLPQFKGDGKDKYRSVKVPGGVVNVYNGFMVTTSKAEMNAWGRNYCRAYGNAPLQRLGGDYLNGQVAASRYASEKHRA